tara:strand:- start:365 stop:667 length:303 start_codon:yes stop_codon:yes gene_type:complete
MKDKRTYTHLKEHGEDMTHENESKMTVEPKTKVESSPSDLIFLIEEHKKEIWEWKKKESEWIKTENQLANAKNLISELSSRLVKAFTTIAQLEKKLKDKE